MLPIRIPCYLPTEHISLFLSAPLVLRVTVGTYKRSQSVHISPEAVDKLIENLVVLRNHMREIAVVQEIIEQ